MCVFLFKLISSTDSTIGFCSSLEYKRRLAAAVDRPSSLTLVLGEKGRRETLLFYKDREDFSLLNHSFRVVF